MSHVMAPDACMFSRPCLIPHPQPLSLPVFVCVCLCKCDRDFAVWEVLREEEFSPLKNADGAAKDTPTTCRHDLFNLHRSWLNRAGAKLVHKDGSVIPPIQR